MAEKLRMMGIDYVLVYNKQTIEDLNVFGYFCAKSNVISLDKDLGLGTQKEILIHEILEGLNYHLELNLEHNVINSLGSGLNQVIEDNPKIFKNVFKGIK